MINGCKLNAWNETKHVLRISQHNRRDHPGRSRRKVLPVAMMR